PTGCTSCRRSRVGLTTAATWWRKVRSSGPTRSARRSRWGGLALSSFPRGEGAMGKRSCGPTLTPSASSALAWSSGPSWPSGRTPRPVLGSSWKPRPAACRFGSFATCSTAGATWRRPTIGYVVSTWPRLSQTFVLNEILALEKRGLPVRIFSTKDPDGEPVHAKLAKVRAPVTYLSFRRRVRAILLANVRIARRRPGAYARTLLLALRLGRADVLWRLLQAGYLADLLCRDAVAHLHAHFATGPAQVAMLAHELVGIPYSFTAHARDIYVDTPPTLLRAEMEQARAVITVSEYNRQYLLSRIS